MDDERAPRRIQTPDRLALRERLLLQWVATAAVGDPFPPPWSYASSPLTSMVRTLVDLGVMAPPREGADLAVVAREASAAARAWLEQHPAGGARRAE